MAPPSGDPDRDFAAMMIPHHQGAIDMAEAVAAATARDKRRERDRQFAKLDDDPHARRRGEFWSNLDAE